MRCYWSRTCLISKNHLYNFENESTLVLQQTSGINKQFFALKSLTAMLKNSVTKSTHVQQFLYVFLLVVSRIKEFLSDCGRIQVPLQEGDITIIQKY